jgi:AcrR family transcriptional regulator
MRNRQGPDPARRSERAHAAILDAARRLVIRDGYDRLTIEAIAATAGVGKQTIYRWWPSKAAVALDTLAPKVEQHTGFPDTGDLAADLKSQVRSVIQVTSDPEFEPFFRALVAESQHDQALSTQLLERIFQPRIAACKERLRSAQAADQLPADTDLDLAVDLLYGGFYHRYLLRVAPLDADYADQLVDAALAALTAPVPGRQ